MSVLRQYNHRIYWRKFLTSCNQTSRYFRKRIRRAVFCGKMLKTENLCLKCQQPIFISDFTAWNFSIMYQPGKRYKTLEILQECNFTAQSKIFNSNFYKDFENRLNHKLARNGFNLCMIASKVLINRIVQNNFSVRNLPVFRTLPVWCSKV